MWEAPWQPGEFVERQREIMDKIEMLTPGIAKERERIYKEKYTMNRRFLKSLSKRIHRRRK